MINAVLKRLALTSAENRMNISLTVMFTDSSHIAPRIKAVFTCQNQNRRLPVLIKDIYYEGDCCTVTCEYTYLLNYVFFHFHPTDTVLQFLLCLDDEEVPLSADAANTELCSGTHLDGGNIVISQERMRQKTHFKLRELKNKKVLTRVVRSPLVQLVDCIYRLYCLFHPVKKNRVTFMSGRRTALGGNSEFVYNLLKNENNIDIQFLLYTQTSGWKMLPVLGRFLRLYATSRVVIIDDYFKMLNLVQKREGVKLLQLWHACGAFKTFGFTRLGKEGGPMQFTKSHRMYDYAVVSSQSIARHYAEGFGISEQCVLPTGVPRTDIFLQKDYAERMRERFFAKYPHLKDKKLLLFAPTFRGNGQQTAFYPTDRLNLGRLYEALGGEYAILVKLHPFCRERFAIDKKYNNYIIDLSAEDELNDLLFVTNLLITDYSSVIFEASLLDIPMLFYAFDLEEYIADRDFYYDFRRFVPGKIVADEAALTASIQSGDFEQEKITGFKNRFFDSLDGCSSARVRDIVLDLLEVDYE